MKLTRLVLLVAVGLVLAAFRSNSGKMVVALDSKAWECSQWISVKDAPVVEGVVKDGMRAADGASWFTSKMKTEKKVTKAVWMTTGLGVYNLYVNGEPIGDEFLKPGFTHPYKTRRSFTYDVTASFKTAAGSENVLAVEVTPGWWGDKIVTPGGSKGMLGRKCAFRGVLELTYSDGSTELFGSDTEHWLAAIAGPTVHAAIFDGEVYDARIPAPVMGVDGQKPEVNDEFKGEILPTDGAEIYLRRDLTLAPIKAYTWEGVKDSTEAEYGKVVVKQEFAVGEKAEPMTVKPGETLVVDFGQNCAGVPSFVFQAKEGTVLRCEVAELLNDGNGAKSRGMDGPEGSAHRTNLRIPKTGMWLSYTFANSKKPVAYYPQHTFFGYRFISITVTDEVTIQKVESVPVTSIAKGLEIGKITTGDESVNKLISNTIWGQRSNYLSVPTDCPQRNERLGWTADTQVFTATGSFFANTKSFFHKWMRDMRDSQDELGGFPGVAPYAQYGNEMFRVGWSDAGVIVPWTIWKQFGDVEMVNESWASMEKYLDYLALTKYDHKALAHKNGNFQWADWLSYEALESCGGGAFGANGPLPETLEYWSYLCASYWLIDANMMHDMALATGRDAKKYEQMVADARAYIQERFMTPEGTFKTEILNTMQTPVLFALKNEIVSGDAKKSMLERLRKNFAEHGNCLQTGFLGTSILMATLTENGMVDIAYELLFQRKNPSWLYSVDNGATTIWERWNSYMLDKGMGPKGMNSFNHYAYGCVCQWIWETAAGIASDPKTPGFKHIIMRPIPDKRLGHLDAEYVSAAGVIKSSWRYEGDKWLWKFSIPKGATATVTLPGQSETQEFEAGEHQLSVSGVR